MILAGLWLLRLHKEEINGTVHSSVCLVDVSVGRSERVWCDGGRGRDVLAGERWEARVDLHRKSSEVGTDCFRPKLGSQDSNNRHQKQ